MKKKDILSLFIMLFIIIVGLYRYKKQEYQVKKSAFIIGTQVEITVKSKDKNLEEVIDKGFKLMKFYDDKLSFFQEESEVWKLNNSLNETNIISEELIELVKVSKELYRATDGLFDPSIGVITELWDFNEKKIPSSIQINEGLKMVGFDKVFLEDNYLTKPVGMKLNFGAIAKGFIVDKVMQELMEDSVTKILINAGGDLRVYDKKNRKINIGIKHPRGKLSDLIAKIKIENMAVVTSGDYEQFFEIGGKRYHHILSPKTGFPIANVFSVTVIAPNTTIADALSTALFLIPPEEGIELLNNYPNSAAIIYYQKEGTLISLKSKNIKDILVEEYAE